MSYTKKDRNDAIVLIGSGHSDISRTSFYEQLESFNWIKLCKLDGVINRVELIFLGNRLFQHLIKKLHPEWD